MKLSKTEAKKLGIYAPPPAKPKPKRGKHRPKEESEAKFMGQVPQNPVDVREGRDALLDALCQSHGLPIPVHEYEFHPTRKWRFDLVFDGLVAVEIQGGIWKGGHHSRGKDQLDDMAKYNAAQIQGFIVLQFTPQQFQSGEAFPVIREALGLEGD